MAFLYLPGSFTKYQGVMGKIVYQDALPNIN